MSITAMKQALEALELSHPSFGVGTAIHTKAVATLRDAIEQAEQAQPAAVYRAGQAPGEVYHVQFFKEMNADEVLLYTAPPQRQPLNDLTIADIYAKWDATPGVSMADFARAIEAAHGIKGEA